MLDVIKTTRITLGETNIGILERIVEILSVVGLGGDNLIVLNRGGVYLKGV